MVQPSYNATHQKCKRIPGFFGSCNAVGSAGFGSQHKQLSPFELTYTIWRLQVDELDLCFDDASSHHKRETNRLAEFILTYHELDSIVLF